MPKKKQDSESVVGEPYIRSRVANNTTNMKILIVSKIGSVTAFLFQILIQRRKHTFPVTKKWIKFSVLGSCLQSEANLLNISHAVRRLRNLRGHWCRAAVPFDRHHNPVFNLQHSPCRGPKRQYRVTHHVVSNFPMTSKQKFRFSMRPMYQPRPTMQLLFWCQRKVWINMM